MYVHLISFFWILFGYDLQKTSTIEFSMWDRDASFDNRMETGVEAIQCSAIKCAEFCYNHGRCVAFLTVPGPTKTCILLDTLLTSPDLYPVVPSSKYYLLHDDSTTTTTMAPTTTSSTTTTTTTMATTTDDD